MQIARAVLVGIAFLALCASFISLFPANWWLIRMLDLVVEPATYALMALLAIGLIAYPKRRVLLLAVLGLAIIINITRIWPYMAIAPEEIELVADADPACCFTAYSANVEMKNSDYPRLIAQVEKFDPDIVFLTETDTAWVNALTPLIERYSHKHTHPQPDTFGKVFLSRMPVLESQMVERINEDTPTLTAIIRASDTALVEFIGLHPKAPLPGQDTKQRDQSIMNASKQADGDLAGGIAMGDFNDVPWSYTTTALREQGDWRDPRIGRGTYPTFPSGLLPIGWPLDQIMVKGEVSVSHFEVLDSSGSDHRAIFAQFCVP